MLPLGITAVKGFISLFSVTDAPEWLTSKHTVLGHDLERPGGLLDDKPFQPL